MASPLPQIFSAMLEIFSHCGVVALWMAMPTYQWSAGPTTFVKTEIFQQLFQLIALKFVQKFMVLRG